MYKNKSISVVVPCYNEENQINGVIETMPDYVDKMVVVDDCSRDNTISVVEAAMDREPKVILIKHEKNQGVGGAIATGYNWSRDNNIDAAVVMAGDGQMDPIDLPAILNPVVNNETDYSKGNRLFTGEAYKKIPKIRYFGNAVLSLFTKIASGYWHIADSQTGYTAINKLALHTINWEDMYKRYGQPNDLLVKLNVYNFRVRDININPVYGVGEKSGIKIRKVIFSISWLLLKKFVWRLKEKYIIRNFHPLVFFYFLGFIFSILTLVLSFRLFYIWLVVGSSIPKINALAVMFSFMSASQFILFAMWFDRQENEKLQ